MTDNDASVLTRKLSPIQISLSVMLSESPSSSSSLPPILLPVGALSVDLSFYPLSCGGISVVILTMLILHLSEDVAANGAT